jgi:hypothetical protein
MGAAALVVIVAAGGCDRTTARADRSRERARTTTTVAHRAIPSREVRSMPLPVSYSTPIFGGGYLWISGARGLERIDVTTGVASPVPDARGAPVAFEGGRLWLLGLDHDRRCASEPEAAYPEYWPYVVSSIDPATNATVSRTELAGTCRYGRDNRDPSPVVGAGGGSVYISEPLSCHEFRIDASTGAIASTFPLDGGVVVASDPHGAWRLGSGSCSQTATPRFDRVDGRGSVVGGDLLPGAAISSVTADDRAAWVTSFSPSRFGSSEPDAQTPLLTRVDAATRAVRTTGVHPGSVAIADGEVWFLGSYPNGFGGKDAKPNRLGRLDPDTGAIVASFDLEARDLRSRLPDQRPTLLAIADGRALVQESVGTARRLIEIDLPDH